MGALVIDTPPHPSLSIVNYPLSTNIPIFPAQNADPMSEKTERLPSPKIILTDEQRNVVEAFEQFLTGDNKVFILLGAAGTGKTTLLSDLIRVAEKEERPVTQAQVPRRARARVRPVRGRWPGRGAAVRRSRPAPTWSRWAGRSPGPPR